MSPHANAGRYHVYDRDMRFHAWRDGIYRGNSGILPDFVYASPAWLRVEFRVFLSDILTKTIIRFKATSGLLVTTVSSGTLMLRSCIEDALSDRKSYVKRASNLPSFDPHAGVRDQTQMTDRHVFDRQLSDKSPDRHAAVKQTTRTDDCRADECSPVVCTEAKGLAASSAARQRRGVLSSRRRKEQTPWTRRVGVGTVVLKDCGVGGGGGYGRGLMFALGLQLPREMSPPSRTPFLPSASHSPTSSAPTKLAAASSQMTVECGYIEAFLDIGVLRADVSEASCKWSRAGMQGRRKLEIPEKTRRPAASSGAIPTCEKKNGSDPIGNRTNSLSAMRRDHYLLYNTHRNPSELDTPGKLYVSRGEIPPQGKTTRDVILRAINYFQAHESCHWLYRDAISVAKWALPTVADDDLMNCRPARVDDVAPTFKYDGDIGDNTSFCADRDGKLFTPGAANVSLRFERQGNSLPGVVSGGRKTRHKKRCQDSNSAMAVGGWGSGAIWASGVECLEGDGLRVPEDTVGSNFDALETGATISCHPPPPNLTINIRIQLIHQGRSSREAGRRTLPASSTRENFYRRPLDKAPSKSAAGVAMASDVVGDIHTGKKYFVAATKYSVVIRCCEGPAVHPFHEVSTERSDSDEGKHVGPAKSVVSPVSHNTPLDKTPPTEHGGDQPEPITTANTRGEVRNVDGSAGNVVRLHHLSPWDKRPNRRPARHAATGSVTSCLEPFITTPAAAGLENGGFVLGSTLWWSRLGDHTPSPPRRAGISPTSWAALVKAVHDKVSTFETNLRKKSLPLPAYTSTCAQSDVYLVKLVTMDG
ncbi:hypothetical protein PR048_022833 [Dryococelus australis]|uniref:Uncharacterized protein n=1 Tax=Dryococelus australis TaxID=614101 RepID=A0ABQ9GSE0_9NEOP|nr:hypothetical protein PR048_022833 [Dryococelus australis]